MSLGHPVICRRNLLYVYLLYTRAKDVHTGAILSNTKETSYCQLLHTHTRNSFTYSSAPEHILQRRTYVRTAEAILPHTKGTSRWQLLHTQKKLLNIHTNSINTHSKEVHTEAILSHTDETSHCQLQHIPCVSS